MVLNTIAALVAGFVLLAIVATTINAVGGGGPVTFLTQTVVNTAVAYALLSIGYIGFPVAVVVALFPAIARAFAYIWFYYQGKRVLDGKMGKEARWSAELVQEGSKKDDDAFLQATANLSKTELREVGIIADSKEELRERTIERVEGDE